MKKKYRNSEQTAQPIIIAMECNLHTSTQALLNFTLCCFSQTVLVGMKKTVSCISLEQLPQKGGSTASITCPLLISLDWDNYYFLPFLMRWYKLYFLQRLLYVWSSSAYHTSKNTFVWSGPIHWQSDVLAFCSQQSIQMLYLSFKLINPIIRL